MRITVKMWRKEFDKMEEAPPGHGEYVLYADYVDLFIKHINMTEALKKILTYSGMAKDMTDKIVEEIEALDEKG